LGIVSRYINYGGTWAKPLRFDAADKFLGPPEKCS